MSVLWIVDRGSPRDAIRYLPANSSQNIIVYNESTTAWSALIREVQQRVTQPVNRVRIISHGNSGQLTFSNGSINAENVGVFQFLRGLIMAPVLNGTAGIEIHGCGVASGYLPRPVEESGIGDVVIRNYGNMQGQLTVWGSTGNWAEAGVRSSRGVNFLQRMAAVCGVCVTGGVDYQLADANWQYEGPTLTVCPNPFSRVRLFDAQNRLGFGQIYYF